MRELWVADLKDGGLVTAAEFNDGHGGRLRIRYWPTLDALLRGRVGREFLAPRTLSACNEGTPSIRQIVFDPDVEASASSSACTTTGAAGSTGRLVAC
ncbi:MAG TPA: hypothetical protein VFA45_24570 [Actinomycetes bacterium]|jgi:hypothetical protein|nr:hypothetical protein [Actinomycetes bacterium]